MFTNSLFKINRFKKIFVYKYILKIRRFIIDYIAYQRYCLNTKLQSSEIKIQKKVKHNYSPLISIIVPLYNTKPLFFHQLMKSLLRQTYTNWEVCFCDGSTINRTKKLIEHYQYKLGDKLKVKYLGENFGISGNTNEAIKLASGDFIGFMDHDDMLTEDALFEMVKAINEYPEADFFYSDEDKINYSGIIRSNPFFKPAYSPDTLRSVNYICHFVMTSKKLLDSVGYCRSEFDGSQDHDLVLRLTERSNAVVHIPRILYHWRIYSQSTSSNIESKSYIVDAGCKAIKSHIQRIGIDGYVEPTVNHMYRVSYKIIDNPKVSIIILNKDNDMILRQCIESILVKTTYSNFDIIIVENNSTDENIFNYYEELSSDKRIKIKIWNQKFNFSAACNYGAEDCDSPYLLFLNNDTTVISPDWLERMLEHLQNESVGIVGSKLLYQDRKVQHGGVIIGLSVIAGHPFLRKDEKDSGYKNALITIRNVSAVTGACLMIRRDIYEEVIMFDEEYPVAFSDIDLCLKVLSKGYFIVWTPYSILYHLESYTRGYYDTEEKLIEMNKEFEIFRSKWQGFINVGDPYYNPNLSRISWKSYQVNIKNDDFRPRINIRKKHCV
jgi:GT2 family glycosyltransferase